MNGTIEKRGVLAHQVCYLVRLPSGVTNSFKTLRQAEKWLAAQAKENTHEKVN